MAVTTAIVTDVRDHSMQCDHIRGHNVNGVVI